jgi:hypothetical protein
MGGGCGTLVVRAGDHDHYPEGTRPWWPVAVNSCEVRAPLRVAAKRRELWIFFEGPLA